MTGFFLRLIGVGDELTTHVDQVEWGWTHPGWLWLLLPVAGAGAGVVWLHRRYLPHIAPLPRQVLSVCRIAVLVLLVLVLAGPLVRLTLDEELKPVLAVVVDESQSMGLPVGRFTDEQLEPLARVAGLLESPDDPEAEVPLSPEVRKQVNSLTRLGLADQVLKRQWSRLLAPLQERFELRSYRVARQVRQVPLEDDPTAPPAQSADATALGAALDQVLDDAAGRALAGVVLLSDGRSTAGPEPLKVIRQRARPSDGARLAPCPVFAVPVGSDEPLPDVALLGLLAPGQVALGDSVTVIASIESRGFDGQTAKVRLFDGDREIGETAVVLDSRRRQRAELAYTAADADTAAMRTLTVKVEPLAGEDIGQNNQQTTLVQVGNERLRLLYLEGAPRWDFCFLDHALRADQGIDVTIVMESQLETTGVPSAEWDALAQLAAGDEGLAQFQTIILGDVTPALIPAPLAEVLARAVEEEGVGLIVQAGPRSMPHRFMASPLARLLPFQVKPVAPDAPVGFAGTTAAAFAPFRMAVSSTGSLHPAFQLYDSATKNRRLWSRMPTFFWAADAGRSKPGATVLATFEAPQRSRPLIAEQFAGRGRVMMLGIDSTFLWRRNIGSHLFYRFWGQAIRHVARRPEREPNRSWLDVYPGRIEPGEPLALELYTIGADGEPLDAEYVTVEAGLGATNEQIRLDAVAGQPGLFRGAWTPRKIAETLQLRFVDARGRLVAAAVEVTGSGQEMLRPVVDRDALNKMAQASGGRLLELDAIERLPQLLKAEPVMEVRQYSEEVWDNWLTLLLLVSIYCIDVGVRRLQGLT